ncbi:MAG: GntR family transcriptional regulator [Bacteroidales bacterium]
MEFRENQAIYLQIADHFIENILTKKWPEGERIPSVRELAVQLEVNPNTVVRTYNHLQEQNIIYNKRGIGYFVAENGFMQARKLKKDEFVKHDVPEFFRKMEMLDMMLEELYEIYKEQKR